MIVVYETEKEIISKLKTSKVLENFIKENKEVDSDDFYGFASDVIHEIYGELGHKNFRSISHAAPWFAERQNILRKLLKEGGVQIAYKEPEVRPKLSFAEWDNRHQEK